jgi:signal transduction histidine kinase
MSDAPIDPRWPKVLSLSVHEFRTPITVVSGYIRMLLTGRAGELTDKQRNLLQLAEISCGRLSALVAETSELSTLEGGTASFNMQDTDLYAALQQAIDQLPPLPDGREIQVAVDLDASPAPFLGDPVRLGQALRSVLAALRREVISDEPLTVRGRRIAGGYELRIGDGDTLAALDAEKDGNRGIFDEWRGGVGLSLMIARRIIDRHGGRLFAPPGPPESSKAGARIVFDGSNSAIPISDL